MVRQPAGSTTSPRRAGDGSADAERPSGPRLRRGSKVPEIVAREIIREVVVRGMAPGQRLAPEHVLQEQYGVARSSVREALRILEAHGLVHMRVGAHGGAVVGDVTPAGFGRAASLHLHMAKATFDQLAEARELIEPLLARRAAENPPAALVAALEAALRATGEVPEVSDPEQMLARCSSFHRVITQISGNPILDLVAGGLKHLFDEQMPDLTVSPRVQAETTRAHADIAHAIVAGDADRAEELMRRHMQHIIGQLRRRNAALLDEIVGWRY